MPSYESPQLRQLKSELEFSGLKPGTPVYEETLRERKVDMCKDAQGVGSCWDCRAFDSCELIKAHLMDLKYGIRSKWHQGKR